MAVTHVEDININIIYITVYYTKSPTISINNKFGRGHHCIELESVF